MSAVDVKQLVHNSLFWPWNYNLISSHISSKICFPIRNLHILYKPKNWIFDKWRLNSSVFLFIVSYLLVLSPFGNTSLASDLSEAHNTHKKGTGFCTAWQSRLLNVPLKLIFFSVIQERTYCLSHKLYTLVPVSRMSCFPGGTLIWIQVSTSAPLALICKLQVEWDIHCCPN